MRYKRKKRVVTLVGARPRRRAAAGCAAGIEGVHVSWGDGTRAGPRAASTSAPRTATRAGSFTLTITARDKAGNEVVDERRLRIGV